ncbi:hypothetical protein ACWDD9_11785 [Kitasatospora sp. NPDC001119]
MPDLPLDFLDEFRQLKDQVRQLAGRAQMRPAMDQVLSGSVVVGEGGTFKVNSPAGPQFYVGGISPLNPDGSPQRGLLAYRQNGTIAIEIANQTANAADPQCVVVRDARGGTLFAEDVVSGGLAVPYLPVGFSRARYTDWPTSVAGSFEDVHRSTIVKQQPYMYVSIGHTSDDPATTGEVRVTVNGTAIGSPVSVGFVIQGTTVGPFPVPGAIRSQVEVRVQARRTAGTGNIRCEVLAASGIGS